VSLLRLSSAVLTYGVCRNGTEPGCGFSVAVRSLPSVAVPPDPNEPITGVVQTLTEQSDRSNALALMTRARLKLQLHAQRTPSFVLSATFTSSSRRGQHDGDVDERPEMALVGNGGQRFGSADRRRWTALRAASGRRHSTRRPRAAQRHLLGRDVRCTGLGGLDSQFSGDLERQTHDVPAVRFARRRPARRAHVGRG
jgi:hypothetical protein